MSEMINKTAPEGNVPLYLFRSGKNSHSYEYMGVHNTVKDGKACTVCRVWAPNAQAVAITGDFCEWDPEKYPLTKIDDAVWEGYTDEPLKEFDAYKLVITAEDGTVTYKADPVCVPRRDTSGHGFPLLRHFGVQVERRPLV